LKAVKEFRQWPGQRDAKIVVKSGIYYGLIGVFSLIEEISMIFEAVQIQSTWRPSTFKDPGF
jgi:hypothetical protein